MPEIASIASMPPVAPAQGGTLAPTAASPAGADPRATDFLAQLKAALKGLAGVVATPLPAPASPTAAAQVATSPDPSAEPTQPEVAAKSDDAQSADMPEILAALGFVLVPTPIQPRVAATPDTAESAPVAAQALAPSPGPSTPRLIQPQPVAGDRPSVASQPETTADVQSPKLPETATSPHTVASAPADAHATPVADVLTNAPANTITDAPGDSVTPTAAPRAPSTNTSAPHRPEMPTAATTDTPTSTSVVVPPVASQQAPAPRHTETSTPAGPSAVASAVDPRSQGQPSTATGFDSTDSGDRHEHSASRSSAVADTSASPATAPVNEQTFAAAVANTTAPTQPQAAQPSQVVAQIAHQADLYRLPGNRGVRIQLHPDDLGGVQVTVRYAATGGLELHINVEHAATGALVQAGWSELRDALATQGISPDRLVMSVTGPSNASQLDFSSNGGGYRSDSGLAGFMQGGQSGQQRHDGSDEPRTWRGWSGGPEPLSPSPDDMPRTAAPAASRIDYRV